MILDKAKKKRIIVYVSTIVLSIIYLFTAYKIAIGDGVFGDKEDIVTVRAKVLRITDEKETVSDEESGGKISMQYVFFEAKAVSGEVRGKTLYAVQERDLLYGLPQPTVEVGDKVILVYEPNDDGTADYYLSDFSRITPLIMLCAFFFLLILISGAKRTRHDNIARVHLPRRVHQPYPRDTERSEHLRLVNNYLRLYHRYDAHAH